MESRRGVFKTRGEHETYVDVNEAISTIDAMLTTSFDKTIFREVLSGFKILIKALHQRKENEEDLICDILLKWLELYMRCQNALNADDIKLNEEFEKFVPATISYIIAALPYNPNGVTQYHFRILDILFTLLNNITESALKKVADLISEFITYLWRPIDVVGDFNTQMLAFRIVIKLLKCLNDIKQAETLKNLQKSNLHEPIFSAVRVYNFPSGKFEKIARHVLNHYNMILASNNVLVYSMKCKSGRFDNHATFCKNLHEDHLWIDLNYSPRTITFESRYRPNIKTKYISVGVTLHVVKLSLSENILSADLGVAPKFSTDMKFLNNLDDLRRAQFELPDAEVLRLQENHCVIDYFNAASCPVENSGSQVNDDVETPIDNENQVLLPTTSNESAEACNKSQDSFNPITASSGEVNKNGKNVETDGEVNTNLLFKIPSLPSYETATRKNRMNDTINDSPKTSRTVDNDNIATRDQVPHPIVEISSSQNNGRRFFKHKSDSSDDTVQSSKKRGTVRKNVKRSHTRKVSIISPKRKQVNKVKPMNHLAKDDGDPEEAVQEYVENGGIVNITNFLRNGNESAAVFNNEEQRIILRNVARINNDLERSAKRFFRRNDGTSIEQISNPSIEIYDQSDSEAEPGRSYRNFQIHRPSKQQKPKQKRTRKNANAEKITDDNQPSTSKAAAERSLQRKRKADVTKSAGPLTVEKLYTSKEKSSKKGKFNFKNKPFSSTDMEIDLTSGTDNVLENCFTMLPKISAPKNSLAVDDNNENQIPVEKAASAINDESFNEIQIRRDSQASTSAINDIVLSPTNITIHKNYSPALSDFMEETPKNTTEPSTSTDDRNQIGARQNNLLGNIFQQNTPFKNGSYEKDVISDKSKPLRCSQKYVDDCILYRSRSDTDSGDESDNGTASINNRESFVQRNQLKTPNYTVEHIAKKSIIRSTRNSLSLTQPSCEVTTSITTRQVISQDVFLAQPTTKVNELIPNNDSGMETHELTTLCDSNIIPRSPVQDAGTLLDVTHHQITKDVAQLPPTPQENIKLKFQEVYKESSTAYTILDDTIKKVIDYGERMLSETEKERLEMEQAQKEIDKILCKLSWHYEGFKSKIERFNSLKENMERLLDAMSHMN